jgi:hypothetical protein
VGKVEEAKLPKEKEIRELVGKYLVAQKNVDADWVWDLKYLACKSAKGETTFDVRLFDKAQAAAKNVPVKDYASLDAHPELILYEGWFDTASKKVEVEEKAGFRVSEDVIIHTKPEIWAKLMGLKEPGSSTFFYLAGSPSSGGPLGRGAAVVELNPNYPGKKQKKYIMYTDDVEGTQPVGKRQKSFDTDKAKDIVSWIKERHYQPSQLK